MKRKLLPKIFVTAFSLGLLFGYAAPLLAVPGDLDPAFGTGGKIRTTSGFHEKGLAMALQADGKIVIAGERINTSGAYQGLVVRYNSDGSLDGSFGIGGFVIDFAHGGHPTFFKAIAVQADGKIVVAGYFTESGGCTGTRPWIVRYNSDGSRDNTFGGDGAVEFIYNCALDSYGYNYGVAVEVTGKIVVAGAARNSSGNLDFAAARFNTDGEPDTTFNLDGKATYPIGAGNDAANSLAINPTTGRIVLAGYSFNSTTSNNFALVMIDAQGLYDWSFNGGSVTTDFVGGIDVANAVVFQSDGKIIAAGYQATSSSYDFALARYNPNGTLDPTFDGNGKAGTFFSSGTDIICGVALHANGKIIAAGSGRLPGDVSDNFALARYRNNAALDTLFSSDGKLTTAFPAYQSYGRTIAIQTDGKIVVAGYAGAGNDYDVALARYLP